jgi:serine/threonine-protein kinase
MQRPAIPEDEEKRLTLLRACKIIYTPAEEAFDEVARLAADLCGTEIALITLVDGDYQWFKARVGVEQTGTSRDLSFCGHCINHRHPLVVEDTHEDPRFSDNPLVTGDPHIRFYAGVPLLVEEGSAIGAISVADRTPRTLTPQQLASLERLARQIARELRLRRDMDRANVKASADSALAPGATVAGRWRIARELGRGASGAVFEAFDAANIRVALKVLLPEWRTNEEVVERFVREARVLMRLQTPHVGRLIDVGNLDASQGSLPYLALEYLEGTDLGRFIESQGPVPYRQAMPWCADACDGIAEAHALGIIHRDLKPSNVFLASTGESPDPVVKVIDFGIASGDPTTASTAKITNLGKVVGSPSYMSPEQMMATGDVDVRADIWSMGVLLYEILAGETPFRGKDYLSLFANVMTKPPLPIRAHIKEGVPASVEAVVLKCLRRPREERYPSMTALAAELRSVSASLIGAPA